MRVAVLSVVLAAFAVTTTATPAFACGMYEKVAPEPASDRIARARERLDAGHLDEAVRHARGVAHDKRADKALRAEAYSIAAIARWKQGNKHAAKLNFRMARELDPSLYETVVAAHTDATAIRAFVETEDA